MKYISRKYTLSHGDFVVVGSLIVTTNGSGEVFVRNQTGKQIRVSDERDSVIITAQSHRLSPTAKNGLDAFRVS